MTDTEFTTMTTETTSDLFDVVERDFTGKPLRFMAERKTARNAEAIAEMAVIRRGVEASFYDVVPTGSVVLP